MRQIKFRGRRIDTGEFIYGDLLTGGKEFAIISDTLWAMVAPDSVAQLIGIDANGREVYEGDTVIRIAPSPDWKDGDFNPEKTYPMAAAFDDYAAIRDEEIILVEAAK